MRRIAAERAISRKITYVYTTSQPTRFRLYKSI